METLRLWMIRLLRIRPEEEAITRNFMLHNFFQGMGLALFYSTAITSLLYQFKPYKLPLIFALLYIGSAVVQLLAGRIYARLEHNLNFRVLLRRTLWFLVIGVTTLAAIAYYTHSPWFWMAAVACYRLFYMLSNLEFWGLSAIAYDVRQGKRLFGLISAGDILARTLGYLLFKMLHHQVPDATFLFIAAGCYLGSLWFMNRCMHFALGKTRQRHHAHTHHGHGVEKWFGSKLNIGIAKLSFFSTIIYVLLDFFFYSQAKGLKHDHDLQDYILLILILSEAATFVVKLIFSGRVYERLGTRNSLLILPVFGAVAALIYFGTEYFLAGTPAEARAIAILYTSFIALRYSLNDPILLALFQPEGQATRLAGHTGMKTIADPLGMLSAGLLLLAAVTLSKSVALYWFLPVILLICIAWMLTIGPVVKLFISMLQEAIRKRFMDAGDLLGKDEKALTLFREKLSSGGASETLLAIDALHSTSDESLSANAPLLFGRKETAVLLRMLEISAERKWVNLAPQIEQLTHPGNEETVRRAALRVLLDMDLAAGEHNRLIENSRKDLLLYSESLLYQWKNGNENQLKSVRSEIRDLLSSKEERQRLAAVKTISAGLIPGFSAQLRVIFTGTDGAGKTAVLSALTAAPSQEDIPFLVSLMNEREAGPFMAAGLSRAGDAALGELRKILLGGGTPLQVNHALRALEQMNTPASLQLLSEAAGASDLRISMSAMRALCMRTDIPAELRNQIATDVLSRLSSLAWKIKEWISITGTSSRLKAALEFEFTLVQDHLLTVLMMKYGREIIRPVREVISHSGVRHSNALEMLESHLTRTEARQVMPVLESLPEAEKLRRLRAANQKQGTAAPFIFEIATAGENIFTPWTIAVLLADYQEQVTQHPALSPYLESAHPLLHEAAHLHPSTPQTNQPMHPPHGQISLLEKVVVLRGTALFAETPENILATIAAILEEEQVEEGTVLFNKGEIGSCMYIIYEGSIRITDGPQELAVLGSRAFFGELSLLDSEPRSATAAALADTKLLRLDQEEFYELMEQRPEVLKGMIRLLCERIRNLNSKLRESKNQ